MQKKNKTNTASAATNNHPYGIPPEKRLEEEYRKLENGFYKRIEIGLYEALNLPNTPEWIADAIFDAWEYADIEEREAVPYMLNAILPVSKLFDRKLFTGALIHWLVDRETSDADAELLEMGLNATTMYGFSITRETFRETMKKIREEANMLQAERDAEKLTA